MTPQLLIVGHIVKDITGDAWAPGGGALYAAAQAVALGASTAVVTACEDDVHPEMLVAGAEWHVKNVTKGIRFENTYMGGARRQRLLAKGTPLVAADIPENWRKASQVLLTPVFHDVSKLVASKLVTERTGVALGAQGWLRVIEDDRIVPTGFEARPEWLHGDVVFVSEEDVPDPDAVEQWRDSVSTVVLTRGRNGYTVWDQEGRADMTTVPASERDPTGAGDVFAAAFLVRYGETRDTRAAACFAAAAAALSVEGVGLESIGGRAEIESRMRLAGVTG